MPNKRRRITPELASALLGSSGMAVFERLQNSLIVAISDVPAWLHPRLINASGMLEVGGSPFLENFLIDAEACWARNWADKNPERVRSGPWIEVDPDGHEHPLEASAMVFGNQDILLIENVRASFTEHLQILQQAREQHLSMQQLGREIRNLTERSESLQKSMGGLERTLAHAPVSLITFDIRGRIVTATGDGLEQVSNTPSNLVGQLAEKVFESAPIVLEHVRLALDGSTIEADERFQGRIYEVRYTPLFDPQGQRSGVLRFAYDQTEREEAETLILAARDEAERANLAKTEFVAHMSHELRTPLTSVIGFSEVLYYGLVGPMNDVQREYLANIQSSGEHLLSLINDILDLSRVESGTLDLRFETLEVRGLIESCLPLVRNRAERGRIKLSLKAGAGLRVRGDARKLRQVLVNLISNAVKFTPEGGRVTITTKAVPGVDRLEIAVTDTGIGISPEDQARLFRPFSRVGSEQFEGTGLGLVITRRLVELHGGTIAVSSLPGQGSTFTVQLPREMIRVAKPTS
jgi:signal transduction histidine kinase